MKRKLNGDHNTNTQQHTQQHTKQKETGDWKREIIKRYWRWYQTPKGDAT